MDFSSKLYIKNLPHCLQKDQLEFYVHHWQSQTDIVTNFNHCICAFNAVISKLPLRVGLRHTLWTQQILYSGKLPREKTFVDLKALSLFTKVFSVKFGGVVSFGDTSKQSTKVFPQKCYFPPFHESYLP